MFTGAVMDVAKLGNFHGLPQDHRARLSPYDAHLDHAHSMNLERVIPNDEMDRCKCPRYLLSTYKDGLKKIVTGSMPIQIHTRGLVTSGMIMKRLFYLPPVASATLAATESKYITPQTNRICGTGASIAVHKIIGRSMSDIISD